MNTLLFALWEKSDHPTSVKGCTGTHAGFTKTKGKNGTEQPVMRQINGLVVFMTAH